MGSIILYAVLLFSFVGCGLSTFHGGMKRPYDLPGMERPYDDFGRRWGKVDRPGRHGPEHPRQRGFEYPSWREPRPTEGLPDAMVEDDVMAREDEVTVRVDENPVVCEVCKYLVGDLKTILGNDSTQILAFLDSICNDLPAEYAPTCKKYVDGWDPYIVDFLEKMSPEEICEAITLCTAGQTGVETRLGMHPFGRFQRMFREVFRTRVDKIVIRHALGNNNLCEACNQILEGAHTVLIDDHVLDELFGMLSNLCAMTPAASECQTLLSDLEKYTINLVDEFLNNQTCANIGLCSGVEADPLEPFRGIFDEIFPDEFDADFFPDRSRPRPRPRPDTEPAPRGHPYREHDRVHGHGGRPHPGHHGRRNHSEERRNHTSTRPERPHKTNVKMWWQMSHHGHGPIGMPRPDIQRWWIPGRLPSFWSRLFGSGFRPTKPMDPVSPPRPNKTANPEPEAPRPTLPFVPVPKAGNFEPKKPFIPRKTFVPKLPEDIPVPRVDLGRDIPNFENRRPHFPGKHRPGETKGNRRGPSRKQRSVVINSINTGDTDESYRYDIEGEEPEVPTEWQCDTCKEGVTLVHTLLMEHAGTIQDKLMRALNSICHRLPQTIVAECKSEVASILNGLVVKVINDYVTADRVCPFLKLC